jgi:hypothetical protein
VDWRNRYIFKHRTKCTWAVSFAPPLLYPRWKDPPLTTGYEAGWAPYDCERKRTNLCFHIEIFYLCVLIRHRLLVWWHGKLKWFYLQPTRENRPSCCSYPFCKETVAMPLLYAWILGPEREEVVGDWRKLHNEELHNLYPSPDNTRVIKSKCTRWVGHVERMRDKRVQCFGWKTLSEGPFERPRRRWEGNIIMDHRAIGWEGVDWIRLAQDRDQWRAPVNAVMNLRVP